MTSNRQPSSQVILFISPNRRGRVRPWSAGNQGGDTINDKSVVTNLDRAADERETAAKYGLVDRIFWEYGSEAESAQAAACAVIGADGYDDLFIEE